MAFGHRNDFITRKKSYMNTNTFFDADNLFSTHYHPPASNFKIHLLTNHGGESKQAIYDQVDHLPALIPYPKKITWN